MFSDLGSLSFAKKTLKASELPNTARNGDVVSFFFIMSFYQENNKLGSTLNWKESPIKLTVGTGEAQEFIEKCLLETQLGECNEFYLFGSDPLFLGTAAWNGYLEHVKDKDNLVNSPNSYHILFEIEIWDISSKRSGQLINVFELTSSEKKEEAEKFKKLADDQFRAQNFADAADFYTRAYKAIFYEDGESFNDLKFKIGSNLAFMNLKLKKYSDWIDMNNQLIRFGYPVTEKIFFRNGQASTWFGRLDEALEYFTNALKYTNDAEMIKSINDNIVHVQKLNKDKKDQMRKNLQKIWG